MNPLADPSSVRSTGGPKKDWKGGAGGGRLVLDDKVDSWKCTYDMVLVERIQGKAKKESGLFVPDDELPTLHLCKVLSMGPGREEENGMIAPMPVSRGRAKLRVPVDKDKSGQGGGGRREEG